MAADWTPVALSQDLPAGMAMPAHCAGIDLAIWRGASGQVAAWRDRCPHRGMRLSHGFVRGDLLSCIYHGWRFDGAGQCRKIPAHPGLVPPEAVRATALACVEAHGVIWVAPEDPGSAPPDPGAVVALRSLVVQVPAATLRVMAGENPVRLPGLDHPLTLLMQALPGGATGLHVLMPAAPAAARIAASRAIEAFRRRIEAAPRPAEVTA